jgi:hypothetical protein
MGCCVQPDNNYHNNRNNHTDNDNANNSINDDNTHYNANHDNANYYDSVFADEFAR